ncbi:MAG: glycerophosphodiester phosphodiesterase [Calditrichia bacterium]|nr:glycerophosphodiester phosphodiesterase [Calditrichia bacterium]
MSRQPLIIAHRGDRKNSVENTIDACEKALAAGANALEIDIRQTGTGEIVVFHDFSLKRMFNKSGYIGRTSMDTLKNYPYVKIPDHQSPKYLETLDEFFEQFKNRIPINLDAKTIHFFDVKFAEKIINTIKDHNLMESTWVSCFNPFLLQILKLREKKIRTGYLFQRMTWMHTMYDLITWCDAWHPHYRVLTKNLVKKAKKYAKKLYVWTVNDAEILEKVLNFSIDGIISDEVDSIKNHFSK